MNSPALEGKTWFLKSRSISWTVISTIFASFFLWELFFVQKLLFANNYDFFSKKKIMVSLILPRKCYFHKSIRDGNSHTWLKNIYFVFIYLTKEKTSKWFELFWNACFFFLQKSFQLQFDMTFSLSGVCNWSLLLFFHVKI